ncbi:MAG: amino acid adenylation domain-containing protein [Desulfobacterales bacterium]|nr:amino acid adenylation domain-containing protein [Desulfobacterales bacterium]
MRTIEDFLSYLDGLDIRLWVEQGRLRYNAPKGAVSPDLLNQLRERKPELIDYLTGTNIRPGFTYEQIRPVSHDTDLPLSFAQNRLWFLQKLEPDNPSYNIHLGLHIRGHLDIPVMEKSFNEIISRHEILRTTFVMKNETPVQQIQDDLTISLSATDLQHLSEDDQAAKIREIAVKENSRVFDLEAGPLMRIRLLQLNQDDHVLFITMHHIITDDWSMGIFIREMLACHEFFSAGTASSLPELPIQYADFSFWQRERLKGEELEKLLKYWKKQLADAPPVSEFPFDRQRHADTGFEGKAVQFEISRNLAEELNLLGRRSGCTLFMTLFAAFSVLLYRYCGQEDIVIGTPIANRNRKEIEPLVGFFVNTLVLRTDISGNPCFSELLERVRQVALGAYEHQDMPFEKLVDALHPERNLNWNPLFQIMFALHNAPSEKYSLTGTATLLETETIAAQFDMSLELREYESGLRGKWEYNKDLFEETTICRMAEHWQVLLEGIAANPDCPVAELPLMRENELHRLLVEFNNTTADYPSEKTVAELFEEKVEKNPGKTAVVFEDTYLSYEELNTRANQVAHFLKDKYNIQPDDRIALLLERSEWVIIGIMGILKAGGAYVPIDPGYPEERIKHMVSDSGCKAVLSETGIVKIPGLQAELIDLREIRHENYDNPDCPASPDHLAYVIYTSGSTGVPKGVMIEHRSVVNLICGDWQILYSRFGESMHQALTASFVFDASVAYIFTSLIYGNILYIVTDETLHNPELFVKFLQKKKIHFLDVTPGFLLSVIESKAAGKLPENMCHISLGAETLTPSLIDKFYEHDEYQNISLFNTYGPTESCVEIIWFPIDSDFQPFSTVPIGKPMPNIQVFILDAFLNPVPVGGIGEICLSGAGLARGYLNRPDLTAEKFINWKSETGNQKSEIRLYRTGDLGRWLPDGNIEFMGRNDDQVKIRGYRVELGEIENHLLSHRSISGASVIAKEFRKDYTELAAYMTGDENLNVEELRNHLRTTLPDYMIPSYFIQLDKLPLTTGGKVDRRRLPEPETGRPQMETAYVKPETDIEQSIAGVWQELLKLEKVGIHDNFFDMGGHSLLIIRVQNKLQQIFSRDIPAVDLFRYPTISALARYLEQEQPAFHQVYDRSETREAVKTSRERRRASRLKHRNNN